jgi:hypothetical protein
MKRHAENRDAADEPEKKKARFDLDEKIIILPPEILETIAGFISDVGCRRRLRATCKKWFKLLNNTTFTFGPILSSEIGELVSLFSRSTSLLSLHLLKTKNRNYQYEDLQQLSKLTQLTSFVGNFQLPSKWDVSRSPTDGFMTSLTNLESLEVAFIHIEILNMLTKLRRLKAESFRRTLADPLEPPNLPDLEALNIHVADLAIFERLHNVKHLTVLSTSESIRRLPFTALESLRFEAILFNQLPVTLTRLEIPLRHKDQKSIDYLTNLKHLEIDSLDGISLPLFQNLEVCKALVFPKNGQLILEHLSLLPRLRELQIGLQNRADKCFKLIGTMTTLRTLHVSLEEVANPTPLSSLTNLKSLTYDNQNHRTIKFDWVKELTSLSELELNITVDRRLPRDSLKLTSLHNLTRLVFNQAGVYPPHHLMNFTKVLDLKLQSRTDDPGHLFVGLSALTQLTSLEVVFQIGDDEWQEITQLTNLKSLAELEYVGNREMRLADLTAMQKLTRFASQSPLDSETIMNFTALTSLQCIDVTLDYKTEKALRESLPYLEKPQRFVYQYL